MNCLKYLEMNKNPEKLAKTLSEEPERLGKASSIEGKAHQGGLDVLRELKDQGLPDEYARYIAGNIYKWMTEKNPYYLDEAFLCLYGRNGIPTKTMLKQDAICRAVRMERGHLDGTAEAVERDIANTNAMMQMAYLVGEGSSIRAAARKAVSGWTTENPLKASVLERKYSELKKRGLEEVTRQGAAKMHPEELKRLKNMPDCPDELVGSRR